MFLGSAGGEAFTEMLHDPAPHSSEATAKRQRDWMHCLRVMNFSSMVRRQDPREDLPDAPRIVALGEVGEQHDGDAPWKEFEWPSRTTRSSKASGSQSTLSSVRSSRLRGLSSAPSHPSMMYPIKVSVQFHPLKNLPCPAAQTAASYLVWKRFRSSRRRSLFNTMTLTASIVKR
jgi:hypothetical protein